MAMGNTVLAAERDLSTEKLEICYQSPIMIYEKFEVGEPVDESLMPRARAATIIVNVTSPCDAEFRSRYSDWAYQANRALERADDGLYRLYGIDYRSVAQIYWNSSGTTMGAVLDNAIASHGLSYSGQTADLMAAFTGKIVEENVLGIAYTTIPYALIKDGGYDQNAACAQHETSHTYGCSHSGDEWNNDTGCIMYKYLTISNMDRFCTSHNSIMESNKNRY